MMHVEASESGFYAECLNESCDWWGPLEMCWSPAEDPEHFLCGSCMRPVQSVWRDDSTSRR